MAQVTQQVSCRGRTTPEAASGPQFLFSPLSSPVCPGHLGPHYCGSATLGQWRRPSCLFLARTAALGLGGQIPAGAAAPRPLGGSFSGFWQKPRCCLIHLSPLVLPRASPPNQAAPPVALWCEMWMSHVPGLLAITLPADLKNHCINKTNHDGRTAPSPTLHTYWGSPRLAQPWGCSVLCGLGPVLHPLPSTMTCSLKHQC